MKQAGALLLCTLLCAQASTASDAGFPVAALKPAVEDAIARDRLILVEFWSFKTEPSRSYREKVLSTPPVMAWLAEHGVGARVNVDFNKKLCGQLHVDQVPTLLVLDAGLARWARLTGPTAPEEIVKELEAARAARTAFTEAVKALETRPEDPGVLARVLRGYLRQEDPRRAEAAMKTLRAADPRQEAGAHAGFALAIAQLLEARKADDEALRLYVDAADWARGGASTVRPDAIIHSAVIRIRQGRPEPAVKALALLLEETPEFPARSKALFVLAETCITKLDDVDRALPYLDELTRRHRDSFAQYGRTLAKYATMKKEGLIE